MPIPHGGFSTNEDPRPPSLDELITILRVAQNFSLSTDFEGDRIHVSFKISKEACAEHGIRLRTFGDQFLGALVDHLEHLHYFYDTVEKYSDAEEKGTRVEDCMAFLEREYASVPYGDGLATDMRKRFFRATARKLEELKTWRVFVDQERYQKERMRARAQRDQERKRKAEEQRTADEIRRRQEEYSKRFHEEYQKAGGFEDIFKEAFGGAAREELWKKYRSHFGEEQRRQEEQTFRWGSGPYQGSGFYGGEQQQQQRRERRRTQDKVRPTGKWYEILGVKATATKAEIKSAWRHLAKKHHPDRQGGDADKMAEINAAKDEGLAGAAS